MPALEGEQKRWNGGKGELLLSGAAPLQVITEHSYLGHLSLQNSFRKQGQKANVLTRAYESSSHLANSQRSRG